MHKIILAVVIVTVLSLSTGFRGLEYSTERIESNSIPKQKKELLDKLAGRWIIQTNIYARKGKPASKVIGSDVWQWAADGNFLLHIAHGMRDSKGFGAMEITGYNFKTGGFDCYNFNPDGSFSRGTLSIKNNIWIWSSGDVRTIGIMDDNAQTLTIKHEITEDGKPYELFMDGVLSKSVGF